MFNLDQAIMDWRRQMAARGLSTPAVLDELESHLREDIAEQLRSGSDGQRAFEAAVERLGKAELLRSEFAKASLKRTVWPIASLKLIVLLFVVLFAFTGFKVGLVSAAPVVGGVAALLLIIFAWRYAVRRSSEPLEMPPLTPDAVDTLESARQEASRYHHDFVGTEHILLALLEKGVVPDLLRKLGVEDNAIRMEIENFVGRGPESSTRSTFSYTPRAKKALQLASQEAKAMQHDQIRPECVFLGVLLEGNGVAARVLKNLGLDFQRARAEILKVNQKKA
jgi:hypothetical protein